jgi:peptide/nickel transport system ATP-binding protein
MDQDNLLEVRDLRISFRTDKKHTFEAVKGISFSVPQDATVALVGESGSGKSVSSLAVTCRSGSAASCAARTSR